MTESRDTDRDDDRFDLRRFVSAQAAVYQRVLAELKDGHKRTHWMWFVFPQIDGLGHSATAKYYAIKSPEEAQAYLEHPVLGGRLRQCTETVLGVRGRTASEIFGYPDDMKLKSSMTLFASVTASGSVFAQVLDKYFQGQRDARTLELLEKLKGST